MTSCVSVPDVDMLVMSTPMGFISGAIQISLPLLFSPAVVMAAVYPTTHLHTRTYCGYKCVYPVRHHCRTQSVEPVASVAQWDSLL